MSFKSTLQYLGIDLSANNRLPVDIKDTVNTIQIGGVNVSLFQLAREGMAMKASVGPISVNQSANTVNFGTAISPTASLSVKPGRASLVTSVAASSTSGPLQAYGSVTVKSKPFAAALLGQAFSGIDVVFGVNGGSESVNPYQLIGSEGSYDINFKWLGANAAPYPYVSGSIHHIDFTADFHFDAKKVVMVVGESTSWQAMETDPTGVLYPGEALYPFRLCDSLRSEKKSVRLVNKAFGSASSNDIEFARRSNFYDVDYDLLIYNAMINDKAANTSQAVYQANLKAMITHRNNHRPNASIIFLSAAPLDGYDVSNYRTWMQEVANDLTLGRAANKVYFCDGLNAFNLNATATADTNFALSNRVAGQRVHPSGLGHNLVFQNLLQTVKTTNFYTATNW